MPIVVDIADRLYDYTDEEKAAEAIEQFRIASGLDAKAVLAIWEDKNDPRRQQLEKAMFDAVDLNGSVKRAQTSVPDGITLSMD
ncbi:hypothetical protein [Asticcacaulis endophyticus]|uniref:Uncharacterized protein n=1 Tax=Asticcacaulis endophyticus TaxID=1395890 RepID=A0A918UU30_9CAUL|nr:hypothetical protein [Asticcacaulis endophyticus]GGZ32931.1 hypothetical protein GCM10011273_19020 [Asticcacaulis endophyticus]